MRPLLILGDPFRRIAMHIACDISMSCAVPGAQHALHGLSSSTSSTLGCPSRDNVQAKSEGISNHEIFDKISKAQFALPDEARKESKARTPERSKHRANSQQYISPKGEPILNHPPW